MAPTPSSRTTAGCQTPSRTPHSKQRLHYNPKNAAYPSPNPASVAKETTVPTEHPVEVIGRIRDYPDRKDKPFSALDISQDGRTVRVRTDVGYRDFSLDGVSVSEDEDIEAFYKRFVASRIAGVRLGAKCTVMMYGPTGAGKSHTMFGCPKQPGIVYRALKDILGDGDAEKGLDDGGFGVGLFVQVAVLEIYNEEIYDLLSGSSNGGATSVGLVKGNTTKVRLEVMGKKAKNATYLSGNEPVKISKEVAKVEKRRIVKSTLCNERSSRSHCLIILDVPSVGGRLMLVDMAGSENIEQAGQLGLEAKLQTAKINQGNTALKRVVECIANGDSHVPFRDSKLTMLLQDSFEDDKSKILMILCASPDPKELHKTISTLEYGAKAKCIVRAAHIPTPKEKMNTEESSVLLRSRIVAMNQFIYKLQMDNKFKEKECVEANKELLRKEEELAGLRVRLKQLEGKGPAVKEDEINSKVEERTQALIIELKKMEDKMTRQQEELNMLRQRLEEMEYERSNVVDAALQDIEGCSFMKRLTEIYGEGDQGMEKSMEIDMGEQHSNHDIKEIKEDLHHPGNYLSCSSLTTDFSGLQCSGNDTMARQPEKVLLSTVFEREDEGEELESSEGDEIDKVVVQEYTGHGWHGIDTSGCPVVSEDHLQKENFNGGFEVDCVENLKDAATARKTRIQNIFRLCGNHRELAQQVQTPRPSKRRPEATSTQSSPLASVTKSGAKEGSLAESHHSQVLKPHNNLVSGTGATESPVSALIVPFASLHLKDKLNATEPRSFAHEALEELKENSRPHGMEADDFIEVCVKWEASKDFSGNIIKKLKVLKSSTLQDLRKLIETHIGEDNIKQPFTFLLLGNPSGAPVSKEKEATVQAVKLPICNNQLHVHLACLRPIKKPMLRLDHIPLGSLENTLYVAQNSPSTLSQLVDGHSPNASQRNVSCLTELKV